MSEFAGWVLVVLVACEFEALERRGLEEHVVVEDALETLDVYGVFLLRGLLNFAGVPLVLLPHLLADCSLDLALQQLLAAGHGAALDLSLVVDDYLLVHHALEAVDAVGVHALGAVVHVADLLEADVAVELARTPSKPRLERRVHLPSCVPLRLFPVWVRGAN